MSQKLRKGGLPQPQKGPPVVIELPLTEGIAPSSLSRVKLDIICPDTGAKVTLGMKNLINDSGEERHAVMRLDWRHVQVVLRYDITMVLRNSSGEARFSLEEEDIRSPGN